MKISLLFLLGLLLVASLGFGLAGCVGEASVGPGVYYEDDPGPWFYGGPWIYGHAWYGGYRGGGGWVHHR